jgi:hypothetical protein
VLVEAVVGTNNGRGAALCGYRMAAHWVDLRNDCYAQRWIGFSYRDRRAQASPAGAYNDDIM